LGAADREHEFSGIAGGVVIDADAAIDSLATEILLADELTRRSERLLERRRKQAAFCDPNKTLLAQAKPHQEYLL